MSKLLELKEWLTLSEAKHYFTTRAEQAISEAALITSLLQKSEKIRIVLPAEWYEKIAGNNTESFQKFLSVQKSAQSGLLKHDNETYFISRGTGKFMLDPTQHISNEDPILIKLTDAWDEELTIERKKGEAIYLKKSELEDNQTIILSTLTWSDLDSNISERIEIEKVSIEKLLLSIGVEIATTHKIPSTRTKEKNVTLKSKESDSEKNSLIAKALEKAKNEFISVNEAVHLIAKHGECTPIQAATFLLHHNADKDLVGYTIDRVFKLHELEWFSDRYQAIWSDLDDFVELNNIPPRFDDEGNILDIGMKHGWERSEFFAFSDFRLGIVLDIPPMPPAPPCPPPKRANAWLPMYAHRSRITLGEAALILCGVDPDADQYPDDDDSFVKAYNGWKKALADACDDGRIEGSNWGSSRNDQSLSHTDIKTWSTSTGAPWPFLDIAPAHKNDFKEDDSVVAVLAEEKQKHAACQAALTEEKKRSEELSTRLSELLQARDSLIKQLGDAASGEVDNGCAWVSTFRKSSKGFDALLRVIESELLVIQPGRRPKKLHLQGRLAEECRALGLNIGERTNEEKTIRKAQGIISLIYPDNIT